MFLAREAPAGEKETPESKAPRRTKRSALQEEKRWIGGI
jgi:hypothetical protein